MSHITPLDRSDLPEFEAGFEIIESAMGFVPRSMFTMGRNPGLLKAFTALSFADLAPHFDERQVVELVAVISLFGWLNRWNDTMATDLEDEPLGFGLDHLAARGWEPGKHAHN